MGRFFKMDYVWAIYDDVTFVDVGTLTELAKKTT